MINKIINFTAKIAIGICFYGVYRKTYEWGTEYICNDIETIKDSCDKMIKKINFKKEA